MSVRYWLFKTEPGSFSWTDLENAPGQVTHWEGVRNYQARNYLKSMNVDDGVLFYHSGSDPLAIQGRCRISRAAYPDPFQFDIQSRYYDAKSSPVDPRWWMVDVTLEERFDPPITREEIRNTPGLESMVLLQKGSRLSIQPVTEEEWRTILSLRKG